MKRHFLATLSLVALLLLMSSGIAAAQLSTAELNGRVTDESGAVLPGVTVTATQTATGVTRSAVTDETGSYLLSNLPTGPYRLEAVLQGFRTYVQTGIVLQIGGAPTVNAVLALGSLEESVTVDAAAPLVDVRSAGISSVVENERIVELPLQGRQVTDLLVLAGAAVQTGTSALVMPGAVFISVGGGLVNGVGYTLDGANHNNPQSNSNLPLPFPDALQEFRVVTSGMSAQNGMHSAASVNAVTKSGTNRFAGNAFEFLRHHRFNATSPFALIGPDGTRVDDGLKRNQFGGTFGGPIIRDRLFFFGAYQGTETVQRPSSNVAFVPTAAMLAGDFTAFASPACNGGRPVTLRAPFVDNRINPALFSPAALNLARRLPSTTDPCGQVTFAVGQDRDEKQAVVRGDFQLTSGYSIFGRHLVTRILVPAGYSGEGDNILNTSYPGSYNIAQSGTLGDTLVLSSSVVNSLRVAYNHTTLDRYQGSFFAPKDLGVKAYNYPPEGQMALQVTGAFQIFSGTSSKSLFLNDTYQMADDVTIVKGAHQLGFGANVRFWRADIITTSRTGGNWVIDGRVTGAGLADLLIGRITSLELGSPSILLVNNWYAGFYGQDTWRLSSRVTLNAGLRWEPYFGQNVENDAIAIFNMENFQRGIKSTVFVNAPAGLLYPGDPGFPEGQTGLNTQWWNLSPRAGLAWDVYGDGRLALRSSYSMAYDFMAGDYHLINAAAPPFGNRSQVTDPVGLFDDPYRGAVDPHPIVTNRNTPFVPFGAFGSMDPDINSPRVQSWNVALERQLGAVWAVSAAYLGSYSDRLWAQVAINPGVYMGLGPCTINGVSYTVCSTNANLNQRRVLFQQDPREAAFIGALDLNTDVGFQKYAGLKLATQRRSASGVSLNASYTVSRCKGMSVTSGFNQISAGYTNPADPAFDAGYCDQDRRHLSTLTMGYETPEVGSGALRALASHWRLSGILTARSGNRLNITTGQDNAFNGISAQRPNQVSDDIYGEKTLTAYFDKAAFAQPAPGTFGDLERNTAVGPNYWNIDLAVSRMLRFGTQRLEVRLESFNLLNHFNWGNPQTNFNSGQFGRITTQAGDPRIMQFGVKYDF